MTIRFYERIAKTYRKENWDMILAKILEERIFCAKKLGMWDQVAVSLVELLSGGIGDYLICFFVTHLKGSE